MSNEDKKVNVNIGFNAGAVIAAFISYKLGNTLGWIILHTIFGWFYVLYWALFLPSINL